MRERYALIDVNTVERRQLMHRTGRQTRFDRASCRRELLLGASEAITKSAALT